MPERGEMQQRSNRGKPACDNSVRTRNALFAMIETRRSSIARPNSDPIRSGVEQLPTRLLENEANPRP
jgi:hypothetical protein